jgi:hypothetical protein
MSSSIKKTASNRVNAINSTGPKSKSGKARVSTNAINHGARAKNFLNLAEERSYQSFLKALRNQYRSKNPILLAQLERIAKLKIQLDRIQKIIDASFITSSPSDKTDELLMNLLDMNDQEMKVAEKITRGLLTLPETIKHDEIRVAAELAHLDTSNFESQDDFLFHAPLMCKLLYIKATKHNIDVDDYVLNYLGYQVNLDAIQEKIFDIFYIGSRSKVRQDQEFDTLDSDCNLNTIEAVIMRTKLVNLKKAAEILRCEINKLANLNYKIITFNQLREAEIQPHTINYENLDKLYRYQTTLERQYSRTLGELLIMTKNIL